MKMKNATLYNASQKKVNSISVLFGCVLFFSCLSQKLLEDIFELCKR